MSVKVAVIYYSAMGHNYRLAQAAAEAAKEAGAEVRLLRVPELAPPAAIASNPAWKAHHDATQDVPVASLDDLDWADAYIFNVPTRYGGIPAQMKQFLDSTGPLWAQNKLSNKVVTAMSSAANDHGGQEATILSLYTVMYHWGAIVVTPGYTDPASRDAGGNPYGTSFTASADGTIPERILGGAKYQARRLVTVAEWVKRGRSS